MRAFQPKAIVIPQSETERLLGGLLTELGGRVEWNSEFLGFEQDALGRSIAFKDWRCGAGMRIRLADQL